MINYLKGLNTGILMHEQGFMAMALKIKTSHDQTHMFYLQGQELRDLMMILQNRLVSLQTGVVNNQQEMTTSVESTNQELVNHIPVIEQQEVEQPNADYLVSSLSVSFTEHEFKLVLILKNETLHHITISDLQIHFMMLAIARALGNVKSDNLVALFSAGLNYSPIYDAEFNQNGTIDYSLIENEQWKLDLFSQFYLIIYGLENKDGLELKLGAVVKAHAAINEQEMNEIARNFASKSKRLMPYCNQLAMIKSTPLAFEKYGLPSPNEALQPLAEFHKALRMHKA
ncbi:YjeJ family protein [Leclercia adecarboxylata]|uniref:YjeJ family protein n=1 Tax=Leclercia adecarboxylata TaxID=83655 RepID=UPI002DBF6EA4|nr:YjeJ family protein [Leclercia adecarboxylata]MEB6379551.1 YjeJ family protein [Leclercia adecarboxylata]